MSESLKCILSYFTMILMGISMLHLHLHAVKLGLSTLYTKYRIYSQLSCNSRRMQHGLLFWAYSTMLPYIVRLYQGYDMLNTMHINISYIHTITITAIVHELWIAKPF